MKFMDIWLCDRDLVALDAAKAWTRTESPPPLSWVIARVAEGVPCREHRLYKAHPDVYATLLALGFCVHRSSDGSCGLVVDERGVPVCVGPIERKIKNVNERVIKPVSNMIEYTRNRTTRPGYARVESYTRPLREEVASAGSAVLDSTARPLGRYMQRAIAKPARRMLSDAGSAISGGAQTAVVVAFGSPEGRKGALDEAYTQRELAKTKAESRKLARLYLSRDSGIENRLGKVLDDLVSLSVHAKDVEFLRRFRREMERNGISPDSLVSKDAVSLKQLGPSYTDRQRNLLRQSAVMKLATSGIKWNRTWKAYGDLEKEYSSPTSWPTPVKLAEGLFEEFPQGRAPEEISKGAIFYYLQAFPNEGVTAKDLYKKVLERASAKDALGKYLESLLSAGDSAATIPVIIPGTGAVKATFTKADSGAIQVKYDNSTQNFVNLPHDIEVYDTATGLFDAIRVSIGLARALGVRVNVAQGSVAPDKPVDPPDDGNTKGILVLHRKSPSEPFQIITTDSFGYKRAIFTNERSLPANWKKALSTQAKRIAGNPSYYDLLELFHTSTKRDVVKPAFPADSDMQRRQTYVSDDAVDAWKRWGVKTAVSEKVTLLIQNAATIRFSPDLKNCEAAYEDVGDAASWDARRLETAETACENSLAIYAKSKDAIDIDRIRRVLQAVGKRRYESLRSNQTDEVSRKFYLAVNEIRNSIGESTLRNNSSKDLKTRYESWRKEIERFASQGGRYEETVKPFLRYATQVNEKLLSGVNLTSMLSDVDYFFTEMQKSSSDTANFQNTNIKKKVNDALDSIDVLTSKYKTVLGNGALTRAG